MKNLKFTFKSFMLFTICICSLFLQSCDSDDSSALNTIDNSQFKTEMRYLWADHAVWTREVIIGILDETPSTSGSLTRLLQNQIDIGDAIKPYYGDDAGGALTELLTQHILIAGDILIAARDGDTEGFTTAHDAWYQNGDDISVFLNSANPDNWLLDPMKMHMKNHLNLTLEEAVAHMEGRYADDVQAYDDVFEQLMGLSDELADGIANQFPDRF